MRYVSTRGAAPVLGFEDVLLEGLALDGGLYLPEVWPTLDVASLRGLPYAEMATRVMLPFVDGIDEDTFADLVADAYATFRDERVIPVERLWDDLWLVDLTRGPTWAFKDVALQVVGRLFDLVLRHRGERRTVVGATSGDTGAAAIAGCRGLDSLDVFILHPHRRVSDVQRRLMTTVPDENIHNIAVEGTFDDCQDLVKALFADVEVRRRLRLSAVNSINWARLMAQVPYYLHACAQIGGDRPVSFAVPTGNFGNVFSGHVAATLGADIDRLVVGTNSNDVLDRFLRTGVMEATGVHPTMSPSMDIQVSSNFERLLFEVYDRNPAVVAEHMASLRETGRFQVDAEHLARVRADFDSARVGEDDTVDTIRQVHERSGRWIDPHTAVGVRAALDTAVLERGPVACLATADPAKFPDVYARHFGTVPSLPGGAADLATDPERYEVVAKDYAVVRDLILGAADHGR